MRVFLSALVVLAFVILAAPTTTHAQPGHAAQPVTRLEGGDVIHARAPQPAVITVLPRARVRHAQQASRAHFLPEVARAVQRSPF